MRRGSILILLLLAWVQILPARAQVTSNAIRRVLNIRVNAGTPQEATATAFTLDVDGREYLITAKHVVAGLRDQDRIDILEQQGWVQSAMKIFRCDPPVDIAVLIPDHQLTVNYDLPFEGVNFMYGQEAFFLGFPYGIHSASFGMNGPYPIPMIKHATISGSVQPDPKQKIGLVLLDGYNNPGFSGGPIVYRDMNKPGFVFNILGVVSGFIPEVVPVMRKHPIKTPEDASPEAKSQPWRIQQNKDKSYFEYMETDTYVALNTGIVEGYVIEPAIQLIRKHPIGPEVKDIP